MFVPKKEKVKYDPTNNADNNAVASDFDAQAIAETLYNAMKKTGTDEASVFSTLKLLNENQFKEVITVFGKRKYNLTMGNTTEYFWNTLNEYDLKIWLKNELDDSDYTILKLKFPKILF